MRRCLVLVMRTWRVARKMLGMSRRTVLMWLRCRVTCGVRVWLCCTRLITLIRKLSGNLAIRLRNDVLVVLTCRPWSTLLVRLSSTILSLSVSRLSVAGNCRKLFRLIALC